MVGINQANPAVVTMTNSYPNGTNLILYNTTGMNQIAGMTFTISSSSSTGFTLLGLDTSAFLAPATNVKVTLVPNPKPLQPQFFYLTKVVRGTTTVITVSQVHNYIPGQLVRMAIPASFGMQEGNMVTAQILSADSYTMTLNLDSTLYNPFAFPANSPNRLNSLFATVAPAGARNEYDTTIIPFH